METVLKKFTDPYERKARLYPALLAALPLIVVIALYTDWLTFDIENALYITVAKGVSYATLEIAWGLYMLTACIVTSLVLGLMENRRENRT